MRGPAPAGTADANHDALAAVLNDLRASGIAVLPDRREALAAYRSQLTLIDPDRLSPAAALAYWMNLYNAGALDLAAQAVAAGAASVLRVGRAFDRIWAEVAGEELTLNDIEHGKIRRFGDPRIHGGLVCGSASCPTLRYEPFTGDALPAQLDDQMASFLAGGGAVRDEAQSKLLLSRVFLWYGADFTRPNRMPTLLPARKAAIADALGTWLPPDLEQWRLAAGPHIAFQPYDWSLACRVS